MHTLKTFGPIEVLTITDQSERHLQVRIGCTILAACVQAFSSPLGADCCNRVLDFGRGTYPVGVTLLRRWHVSLTAERMAPGERLADDYEGTGVNLIALGLIRAD